MGAERTANRPAPTSGLRWSRQYDYCTNSKSQHNFMHEPRTSGKVYLVGAGPGDPGLLTLRGARCLQRADLVLYDYLVNPAVLQHAPAQAERVCLGHHGQGQRHVTQEEINARMIQAARQGKRVVRLKGGDPDVFGRGAEEIEALRAAAVPYQTVPGVTAALAAAGYAGIPITHGLYSSAVALVTGHERGCKKEPALDYSALASFPGTLIFYMGITSARQWSQALLDRGKAADTPVAIVRRCTWPDQRVVRSTLATVADTIAREGLRPPAVIVVGDVVARAPEETWFTLRPLAGRRIVITRAREQAEDLCDELSDLGAEVLYQPAITISAPPDWAPVDAALDRLETYDWVVFSSANGVRYLLDRLVERADLRRLGRSRLAAIGPGTAEELARYRLKADLVPREFRAEALAAELIGADAGRRFLLARASRGREVLAEQLSAAGREVDQVVVYSSTDVQVADDEVVAALREGRIDWITVTSSAIARSLARLFGDDLRRAKLASISPITSGELRKLGYEPAAEATQYTMGGLVEAIMEREKDAVSRPR